MSVCEDPRVRRSPVASETRPPDRAERVGRTARGGAAGQHPTFEQRPHDDPATITQILDASRLDADAGLAEALALIYGDLRRIAGRLLIHERRTPTLDTDSLVHEAYLRLARQDRTRWRNRRHLFAVASRIMRRLLVDWARGRAYAKRGGGRARMTTLDGKEIAGSEPGIDVLDLEDALRDLERHDPLLAQIVELRFFGGLNNLEIAEIQQVTSMTVIRRWRLARAWLHRHLKQREPEP